MTVAGAPEFDRGRAPRLRFDPASSATAVVGLCSVAMGMGAALGFIPGFIATTLRDDLDISRGQVGLLVGLYFGCTGVGSILGGRLTDRFGARAAVAVDMGAVATAATFAAIVGTYWSLVVAAIVAGTGYALVNAGTNVAVAAAVTARRRTLAMSIKTAGVPAMAAVAAAVGPEAARRWSWQHLLWMVALISLATGLGAAVVLRDTSPTTDPTRGAVHPTPGHSATALPPGFGWFPVGAFLLIAGSQPLYSWVVPYLERSLDVAPSTAGGISALASLIGLGFMMISALRSDRRGAQGRVGTIMILLAINAMAVGLVLLGSQFGIAVAAIGTIVGISVQLSAIGTLHATIVDRAGGAVARATGLTMTGYYLGALLSPTVFGLVADVTDTFVWSWLGCIAMLLLAVPAWSRVGRVAIVEPSRAVEPSSG